jgi:predicted S18 family serine protease
MKNKTQVKQMYSVAALLLWLVLSASAAMAQIPVTGTVTSKTDNTPMPGVNVVVKGRPLELPPMSTVSLH